MRQENPSTKIKSGVVEWKGMSYRQTCSKSKQLPLQLNSVTLHNSRLKYFTKNTYQLKQGFRFAIQKVGRNLQVHVCSEKAGLDVRMWESTQAEENSVSQQHPGQWFSTCVEPEHRFGITWNLLGVQIIRFHSRPSKSESQGVRPSNLCINKPSGDSDPRFKKVLILTWRSVRITDS